MIEFSIRSVFVAVLDFDFVTARHFEHAVVGLRLPESGRHGTQNHTDVSAKRQALHFFLIPGSGFTGGFHGFILGQDREVGILHLDE